MRNNGYHTWNVGDYYLASDNPPNNRRDVQRA